MIFVRNIHCVTVDIVYKRRKIEIHNIRIDNEHNSSIHTAAWTENPNGKIIWTFPIVLMIEKSKSNQINKINNVNVNKYILQIIKVIFVLNSIDKKTRRNNPTNTKTV